MTIRTLLAGLALVALAGNALGASYTITDFGDDQTVNGNCTLREAIRAASTNTAVDGCGAGTASQPDRINLLAGTYTLDLSAGSNEDAGVDGDLDVIGDLIIEGVSSRYTTIDGVAAQSNERVFDVRDTGNLVLRDLRVQGGNAGPLDGGNLRLTDCTVELIETTIAGGRAAGGGGIAALGTTALTIERSVLHDNEALDFGGGAITLGSQATLALLDSELSDNHANTNGGGLFSQGDPQIYRSVFTGNTATDGGGAFFSGKCDVQFSQFDANQAERGGGLSIAAPNCEMVQSAVLNNTAGAQGGGLHITAGTFVRRSTVVGNQAVEGGGIFSNSNEMVLLDHLTIANNSGAGIDNQAGVLTEVTMLANNIGGNCTGTPIQFTAYNLDDGDSCGLNSDTFPNFPNTDPMLGPLSDNGGSTLSMALLPGSPAIDVVNTEIQAGCQNSPDQRGYPRGRPRSIINNTDVYFCDIGAYEVVTPHQVNTTLDEVDADPADDLCLTDTGNCSLRAAIQQANATPGFEQIVLPAGTFTLTSTALSTDGAAGLDLDVLNPTLIRGAGRGVTIIDGNQLDRVIDVAAPANGLALHPEPRNHVLEDLTVTGGATNTDGGGIRTVLPLQLTRVEVVGNASGDEGGGIDCRADCWLLVEDSGVAFNAADGNGGGVFQSSRGTAELERSIFSNNLAGLGAAGEGTRLRLRNVVAHANRALGSTGAFFANQAIVEDSTIALNQAASDTGGFFVLIRSVIRNSIVAANTIDSGLDSCTFNSGGLASLGHNLTDGDADDCLFNDPTDQVNALPLFDDETYSAGSTTTLNLQPTSPAIDSGDDALCPPTDRIGVARPQDGDGDQVAQCDIGAYEALSPEPLPELIFADGFEPGSP